MGFFGNVFAKAKGAAGRGASAAGRAAGRGTLGVMDNMASAGGLADAGLSLFADNARYLASMTGKGMNASRGARAAGMAAPYLARGADFLAGNAYARNAALGALGGGVYGGLSDDGSVIGGAFKGAAGMAAGTKGFRMLHKRLAAGAARQGARSAENIGGSMLSTNWAPNGIHGIRSRYSPESVFSPKLARAVQNARGR